MKNSILISACLFGLINHSNSQAHEVWADGNPVPQWVKGFCCGVADAHRLTVKQIRRIENGWAVDGFESQVFCFFIPQGYI